MTPNKVFKMEQELVRIWFEVNDEAWIHAAADDQIEGLLNSLVVAHEELVAFRRRLEADA